jgi:WD40 repeat protein
MLTLWSTNNYSHLLNWQDDFSTSYINCLSWNPIRPNEFCLGSSHNTIRFCTINEQTDDNNISLQVVNGKLPLLINEHTKESCDITACVYLTSTVNLVLCATNSGFITCWNSRLCLCILQWKADSNEICYMGTIKHKLLTGSSKGCLKLWNIENLEMNLGQLNTTDS